MTFSLQKELATAAGIAHFTGAPQYLEAMGGNIAIG
jgi:hypothetical protein